MGDNEGAAPARHRVPWDVNRMEAQRRMVIAEPLWVTSSRTTHVDVMCTSNTVRRYVAPGEKERQQSKSKARSLALRVERVRGVGPKEPGHGDADPKIDGRDRS